MSELNIKRHNSSVVAVNKQSDLSDIQEETGNSVGKPERVADYYDKLPDAPREEKLRALVRTLEAFQLPVNSVRGFAAGSQHPTTTRQDREIVVNKSFNRRKLPFARS